jgi:ATP-dependent helicase/nuclease subunit B
LEVLRLARMAWPALAYHNDAALSAEAAAGLFPAPLRASVSQLETWSECPFKHFVRHGLRLGRREDPDVTAVDLSNAYHRVLDGVVADLCDKPGGWQKATAAAAKPVVGNHVAAVGQSLRGDLLHGTARNRYLLGRIERSSRRAVDGLLKSASLGTLRPDAMSIRFGSGKDRPSYTVTTPAGDVVELSGRIDRVDRCGDGYEIVLIDYRLKADAMRLDKVYHGIRLQLFAGALVMNRGPARSRAVGLLDWPITISLQGENHPDDAVQPDDPHFLIRDKPRGVIDAGSISAFHAGFDGSSSPVVSIKINKTGELGDRDRTDAVTAEELESLLGFVERKLGEIAGNITAGEIAVKPYMIGEETPCPRCDYRSVCRFEPGINTYHQLQRMKRTEVLAKVTEAGA